MATKEQLYTALRNADAAGDVEGARKLATFIKSMPAEAAPASFGQMLKDEALTSIPGGFVRGIKDVIDTGAGFLSRLGGSDEAARVQAENDAGKAEFAAAQDRAGAGASSVARVGGNIAATYPVGGVLGAGAKAAGLTRLGNALTSGGFSTGAPVANNLLARAGDMGIRMAGGAGTGYVAAGMIDPDAANTGAAIGAALPPVAKVAGAAGAGVASLVRPFTKGGQEKIAANVLREFSTNPQALANIRQAAPVVDGSMPTTIMAAGDEGLAGLSRTLQSADPRYAAELSTRLSAQNAARTKALEAVAGNTGKLKIAENARDAVTGPMREAVLDAAGSLPARPVLASIDRLLANPDNAGKISQQALREFRARIAEFSPDGQINARALYAIRKDINDVLGGKLQGESGNLRNASRQLIKVKGLIDDAIDLASRRVEPSAGRAVMPYGGNMERAGAAGPVGSSAPRPTWSQYLQRYTQESIPINQMEKLDEVLKSVSTGTVDQSGNAVLSAAKMNNLLRNRAKELQEVLSPEQMDLLRRVSADLNAGQLAANAGKAVGSNTVQNLAGVNVLNTLLGNKMGGSTAAQSLLGRILQMPYGASNKMIQDRLGAAMLDPKEAARMLADPQNNNLLRALTQGAPLAYKAAPAISAQ